MRLFSFRTQTRIASWHSAFGRRERTQSVISGSSTTAFARPCSHCLRPNRLSARSRSIPRPVTRSPQAKPPDTSRTTQKGEPQRPAFLLKPTQNPRSNLLKNTRPRPHRIRGLGGSDPHRLTPVPSRRRILPHRLSKGTPAPRREVPT